jgi:hypothetical protein
VRHFLQALSSKRFALRSCRVSGRTEVDSRDSPLVPQSLLRLHTRGRVDLARDARLPAGEAGWRSPALPASRPSRSSRLACRSAMSRIRCAASGSLNPARAPVRARPQRPRRPVDPGSGGRHGR